jgi:hypothetical protein
VVLGPSDGTLLAYAIGRDVIGLRANGSRVFAWTAPTPVTALAEHGNRVAVAQASGTVSVLADGAVVGSSSFAAAPSAVGFDGSALVAQLGRSLQLSTRPDRTFALPARAALEDVQGDVAAYVAKGTAHLLRLSTGEDAVVGAADHVQLDGPRLVLAAGGRIAVKGL